MCVCSYSCALFNLIFFRCAWRTRCGPCLNCAPFRLFGGASFLVLFDCCACGVDILFSDLFFSLGGGMGALWRAERFVCIMNSLACIPERFTQQGHTLLIPALWSKSDAMGVVHGPGHMEVKYTTTGPCLVEVGTRCHGGEGTWQDIAEECLGYNQVRCVVLYIFWACERRSGSWVRFSLRGCGWRESERERYRDR